jgi:polyisoprenoid-binding protein YceI
MMIAPQFEFRSPPMRKFLLALPLLAAVPVLAQMPPLPGAPVAARVKAGTYAVEPSHTIVEWQVNHFGFNDYFGMFGETSGTLALNPAKLAATQVSIEIPIKGLVTASSKLNEHLNSSEFFDSEKMPTAKFVSTMVMAKGNTAMIHGNLTLHGVTKPIILNAKFVGAGLNPFSKKETIGFHATGSIMRSQFGMGGFVPLVADKVDLKITAAFEKQ